MTDPNMPRRIVDDYITARHYTPGRAEDVRLVVVHTTESACAPGVARNVARWFCGSQAPQASAHYVVGPDEVISCVDEDDTAWHAPGCNPCAIGIEYTARAGWSAEDWQSEAAEAMLRRSADLVADICQRRGIPAVLLTPDELLAGASGIATHATVGRAWHRSDHWDPGPAWPGERWLTMVVEAMGAGERGG